MKSKTTNPEHHTLYPDAPAVQLNQASEDSETQSGAVGLRRVRRAAEECIEDLQEFLRLDPATGAMVPRELYLMAFAKG